MRTRLSVPDVATRATLLTTFSGDDPEPQQCPDHGDPEGNYRHCAKCRVKKNWRGRMQKRFNERGFSFASYPYIAGDPRPPVCDLPGHADCQKHRNTCKTCRVQDNWRTRDYRRRKQVGDLAHTADLGPVVEHLNALEAAGMLLTDVARRTGLDCDSIYDIRRGRRKRVRVETSEAILALPIPARPRHLIPAADGSLRRRVDSIAAHRRVRALAADGFGIRAQAAMMGYSEGTVYDWFAHPTITVEADDAVAELTRRLAGQPGPSRIAAGVARSKGWLGRRYWSEATIADRKYDPLRVIESHGLCRRLQALAFLAHGPAEIGALVDEAPETILKWTLGAPAPAYANQLVIPVYERLSFAQGSDREAADLAAHHEWASPLAWDDIDMDRALSRPRVQVTGGKTSLVLTSTIFDAIDGKIPAEELLHDEKVQVVRSLHRRGWSDRRIGAWLRWHSDLDRAQANVTKFREREGIVGFGIAMLGGNVNYESVNGLILTGAAA